MKLLLTLLVVANVLLFGWFRGWMAPLGGDGRDPARLSRQVGEDRVRVLPGATPADGPSAPGAAAPSGPPAPAVAPTAPVSAAAAPVPAPATPPRLAALGGAAVVPDAPAVQPFEAPPAAWPAEPPAVSLAAQLRLAQCVEAGPMSEAEAVRIQAAFDAVAAELSVQMRRLDDITSWWVYLPPSPIDNARRVAELRQRGITETYVMPDGAWRGSISLGLFRQEELAVALARSIADRGVRGVRVAPRGPGPGRVVLQVRPVTAEMLVEVERLRMTLPEADLRACPQA